MSKLNDIIDSNQDKINESKERIRKVLFGAVPVPNSWRDAVKDEYEDVNERIGELVEKQKELIEKKDSIKPSKLVVDYDKKIKEKLKKYVDEKAKYEKKIRISKNIRKNKLKNMRKMLKETPPVGDTRNLYDALKANIDDIKSKPKPHLVHESVLKQIEEEISSIKAGKDMNKVVFEKYKAEKKILNESIRAVKDEIDEIKLVIDKETLDFSMKYTSEGDRESFEDFVSKWDEKLDILGESSNDVFTDVFDHRYEFSKFGTSQIFAHKIGIEMNEYYDGRIYLIGFFRWCKSNMEPNTDYRLGINNTLTNSVIYNSMPLKKDFDMFEIYSMIVNIEMYEMGLWTFKITKLPGTIGAGESKDFGNNHYFDVNIGKYCGQIALMCYDMNTLQRSRFKNAKTVKTKENRLKKIEAFIEKNELPNDESISLDIIENYRGCEIPTYFFDGDKVINFNGNTKKKSIMLYDDHYYLLIKTYDFMNKLGYVHCDKHETYCKSGSNCSNFTCICGVKYKTKNGYKKHCEEVIDDKCGRCNIVFHFAGCKTKHKCTGNDKYCHGCKGFVKDYDEHIKNGCVREIKCGNCKVMADCTKHSCYLKGKKPSKPSSVYVYDIESYSEEFIDHRKNCRSRDCSCPNSSKQVFSMAYIVSLDTKEIIFISCADDFMKWCDSVKGNTLLFAHNGGKYDNIIMRESMIFNNLKPSNVCQNGFKIIQFKYKKITFRDSLYHISMPLSAMSKAFGVEESKSIFPYRFYTKKNSHYVGDIPLEYYEDKDKEEVKRLGLNIGVNINELCKKYCLLDTMILAKCLSAYSSSMVKNAGLDPLLYITKASYAYGLYCFKMMPKKSISFLQPHVAAYIRKGFTGGRTNCLVKSFKAEDGESIIRSKDVSSLYPAVQRFDDLPGELLEFNAGGLKPLLVNCDLKGVVGDSSVCTVIDLCGSMIRNDYIRDIVGFYMVDITPPKDIYIPVLGTKKTKGKFLFETKPIVKEVYYTAELLLALKNGYKITAVHSYCKFMKCNNLFGKFVDKFYKLKAELKDNPAAYTSIKILINSLWGKFGEAEHVRETHILYGNDSADTLKLLKQEMEGKLRLTGECIIKTIDDKEVSIRNYKRVSTTMKQTKGSIAVAAAITSCARVRLYEALNHYNYNVLYFDTDSVYFAEYEEGHEKYIKPFNMKLKHEVDGLGSWDDEITDGSEFISCGAKMYGVMKDNGKTVVKSKGIPKGKLSFEMIREIVNGETQKCDIKRFDTSLSGVVVRNGIKFMNDTCNKRIYSMLNGEHISIPFGVIDIEPVIV